MKRAITKKITQKSKIINGEFHVLPFKINQL